MKTVTILVPEGAVMASIADPRYMFTAANDLLKSSGKKPLFEGQFSEYLFPQALPLRPKFVENIINQAENGLKDLKKK